MTVNDRDIVGHAERGLIVSSIKVSTMLVTMKDKIR